MLRLPVRLGCWLFIACVLLSPAAGRAQAPPPSCPEGTSTGEDTAGHCCWPEQAWSSTRNVCVGIPRCPEGFVADGEQCRRPACPSGQAISADTAGHCCWPGQVWSSLRSVCVGAPSCPPGLSVADETCISGAATAQQAASPPPQYSQPPPTAAAATPQPLASAVVAAAPATPSSTRLTLDLGGLFGAVTGVAVDLRLSLRLARLLRGRNPASLRLELSPALWLFWQSQRSLGLTGFGLALPLAIAWQQQVGPLLITPHVGFQGAVTYRYAGGGIKYDTTDMAGRALLGLTLAVPARDSGARAVLGFDVAIGQDTIVSPWLGVTF